MNLGPFFDLDLTEAEADAVSSLVLSANYSAADLNAAFPERARRIEILSLAIGYCGAKLVELRGDCRRDSWVHTMTYLTRELAGET